MTVALKVMSKVEAQECAGRIRKGLDGIRADVLELYERQGWKALGYESWRECVVQEFEHSERHLYRLLMAARVEHNVQEIDQLVKTLPESQTRELAVLAPEEQQIVWQVVKDTAPNGEVTAAHLKSLVTVTQDLMRTGAIDDGTGEMVVWADLAPNEKLSLLQANTTEETYERVQRQKEHIRNHYDNHDSQGKVKPAQELNAADKDIAKRAGQDLVGHDKELDPTGLADLERITRELSQTDGWNDLADEEKIGFVQTQAGEDLAKEIQNSRPQARKEHDPEEFVKVKRGLFQSLKQLARYAPIAARQDHMKVWNDKL